MLTFQLPPGKRQTGKRHFGAEDAMAVGARWLPFACTFWVVGSTVVPALSDDRPVLSLPLVCEPHKTCFIQNYVDVDPGPGLRDYACGSATYDQHSGVDFRILSAKRAESSVPVVAAADGTVKALRDGVEDKFFKLGKGADLTGRECGNGVILDHGSGWETQYCHMRRGSIRVTKGQAIKRGDRLGDVGFSGMASFAHVHLTVRHDGKIVDPFLPESSDGACVKDPRSRSLWEPSAAAAFPYRNGELLAIGFAGAPPSADALEVDDRDILQLSPKSDIFVLYGRFINVLKGDRIHFEASGPQGEVFNETTAPLTRNMATYVPFMGKRRGEAKWAAGHYDGRVQLLRDEAVIATALAAYDLK
ncbi:M23 family metallopeptidase [Hyphomicrobium sp.]|uniref:M23 family metallopeptidase n=1 Tax=Hyphomicrobium sp. TaxID=82 RepID=UPI002CAB368F|nr:M23 family metallopeptidase [Hyphomicrobium sp.]HVZ05522.1 M23 family metallopeptidase [Hyphomicrobium sp.]